MPRIAYAKLAPEGIRTLASLDRYLTTSGLDRSLLHLIKVRASQINGCSYCIDMHTKEARADGETEQRLYALSAWRETPFFTPRERAALAWTETLTLISTHGVPDQAFNTVSEEFTEKEIVDLALAVSAINAWNRVAISFQPTVGSYKPTSPQSQT